MITMYNFPDIIHRFNKFIQLKDNSRTTNLNAQRYRRSDKQTDRQMDRRTDATKRIISPASRSIMIGLRDI